MVTATKTKVLKVKAFNEQIEASVTVAGSGPPVVFLHGAGGLRWDGFLDDLARKFTVYAPAHPGTEGDPDDVRKLRDLWDLVLYHYELFDKLGLRSPAVVGHSFGGMIAAEVASTIPDRVSKLALLSPIGFWRDDHPVRDW
ncbi:MAG: alpha/beta fold hydrolase, partial [SAR202 cluster bacterium]|nr:alpha/beta fold hydrolase [SAR202 cluster bacterium]